MMGELPVNYFTTVPWPWCCFQVCKQDKDTQIKTNDLGAGLKGATKDKGTQTKTSDLGALFKGSTKAKDTQTDTLAFIQRGLLFSLLLHSIFPLPPVPARAVNVSHEEDGVLAGVDSLSLRHGLQAGRDQATEASLRKLLLLLQQGGSPMPLSLSASPRTLTVGLESNVSPADCSCELIVTHTAGIYFLMKRSHGTYKQ